MKPYAVLALAVAFVLAACGGSGDASPTATEPQPDATEDAIATALGDPSRTAAQIAEADDDPSLPGEYVGLPAIYGAPYPETGPHVTEDVDYSAQGTGQPPVGGPHWGSGACGADPATGPPFCGPAPWGIYRTPWPAETLVHNMEHAGVIIWYDSNDQAAIDELEAFAEEQLESGRPLVLAPYPAMEDGTIAITVWSRRDQFPAGDLDLDRLQTFIDVLYCRFDPEGFC